MIWTESRKIHLGCILGKRLWITGSNNAVEKKNQAENLITEDLKSIIEKKKKNVGSNSEPIKK